MAAEVSRGTATATVATGDRPASPTSTPAPTATSAPLVVSAQEGVPAELVAAARAAVEQAPSAMVWGESEAADVLLVLGEGEPLAEWIYAVVVPFATVADAIEMESLEASWRAGEGMQAIQTAETASLLEHRWGAGSGELVAGQEALVDRLWAQRAAWSLVPFHQLTPSLKVLRSGGQSPLDPAFDPAAYPFTVRVGLAGEPQALARFRQLWSGPETNRVEERLTRVAMTGVTALVRATAYQMEIRDTLYPGEEVRSVLRAADIAHISNEVSFVPDCPEPHYIGPPSFCSQPEYLALLEDIGIDVVELTGNHLNDWGRQYVPYTLDLYADASMQTFGGGRNLEEAQAPLIVEHNGNQIAFVGCNPVGPPGGWATADAGGSLPCDYQALYAQIRELSDQGHVVIATQQYWEGYHYKPTVAQVEAFHALAEAGAAAVSGSHGHHVQGFDFHNGTFIHYGLGNLFFDQMDRPGTRQTLVDTYIIYDGRLMSVELWTGLIEHYARPRMMTPAERRQLLQLLFEVSGW
ncbi:MAG: CapA family protein [Candidatus Promineifilaceae bacterium]|nr:CapA family protein [Candidatus Promineifilaceae bacterium]